MRSANAVTDHTGRLGTPVSDCGIATSYSSLVAVERDAKACAKFPSESLYEVMIKHTNLGNLYQPMNYPTLLERVANLMVEDAKISLYCPVSAMKRYLNSAQTKIRCEIWTTQFRYTVIKGRLYRKPRESQP